MHSVWAPARCIAQAPDDGNAVGGTRGFPATRSIFDSRYCKAQTNGCRVVRRPARVWNHVPVLSFASTESRAQDARWWGRWFTPGNHSLLPGKTTIHGNAGSVGARRLRDWRGRKRTFTRRSDLPPLYLACAPQAAFASTGGNRVELVTRGTEGHSFTGHGCRLSRIRCTIPRQTEADILGLSALYLPRLWQRVRVSTQLTRI